MKLSVVMPVYNEVGTIEEIIARVQAIEIEKEIIIVDDFSTDGTREMLAEIGQSDHIRVLYHDKNRGKGAALRTGFAAVTGEVVIIQDADLETNPQEYPKLLQPIIDGEADVVFGSRFAGGESHSVVGFWHYVGNKFLTVLSNCFTNLYLTDMETCYKVFRREIIESITIEEDQFGCEPEITAKVAAMNCQVYEVSISYGGRTRKEGKKIGWKDGLRAIWCIIKYNIRRQ
jgi:glycosyltransferase involved in cell wall biosynthesis